MIRNILKSITQLACSPNNVRLVVLGHQKSGTTAVSALLGKISGLSFSNDPLYLIDQGAGQAADRLMHEPEKLKIYCRRHPNLFSQKIVKDPEFIFIFPSVKEVYQGSQFIFIIRDPRDMIRSICNRLGMNGTDNISHPIISDMKMGNPHWELVLSGRHPERKDHDGATQNYVENLAHRWNLASRIYLENSNDIILVKYEDFLENKELYINNLAKTLRIPGVMSISAHTDIQFQPKGNHKVDWLEFFGKENLIAIEEICAKYMQIFSYKPKLSV